MLGIKLCEFVPTIIHDCLFLSTLIVVSQRCLQTQAIIVGEFIPREFYNKLRLFKDWNQKILYSELTACRMTGTLLQES